MPGIIIRPRARILHGHDWVYSTEVLKTFGNPNNGDVISIKDGRDRMLGSAIYHSGSQIVARRFSHQRQELDRDFFVRRLHRAQEYRDRIGVDPHMRRVVWSESDGLPGIIIDRYDSVAILQTGTLAMDQRRDLIAEVVIEVLGVSTVIERNDSSSRKLEGLESRSGVLLGPKPQEQSVSIGGMIFSIDFLQGQKTGFYLDQVTSYRDIARWAQGARVLDCFSNQGAFAIACALAGATEVTAVESGVDNIPRIKAHAQANGVTVQVIGADVFDMLSRAARRGEQYDLIILDPPPFTRTKKGLNDALRGYRELHFKAAQLLAPNGCLATFSCSHHVSAALFHSTIAEAFHDARRSARQRHIFSQSPDHPIVLALPETEYLKGFLVEAMGSF
ncbi:MAG: class I SAM-dependent rRNA methyltransferase [Chthoniobacterales bacterium]